MQTKAENEKHREKRRKRLHCVPVMINEQQFSTFSSHTTSIVLELLKNLKFDLPAHAACMQHYPTTKLDNNLWMRKKE